MNSYKFTILESIQKEITIEANSKDEAIEKTIEKVYSNKESGGVVKFLKINHNEETLYDNADDM